MSEELKKKAWIVTFYLESIIIEKKIMAPGRKDAKLILGCSDCKKKAVLLNTLSLAQQKYWKQKPFNLSVTNRRY
jgi:hypothetical protein